MSGDAKNTEVGVLILSYMCSECLPLTLEPVRPDECFSVRVISLPRGHLSGSGSFGVGTAVEVLLGGRGQGRSPLNILHCTGLAPPHETSGP